jgi:hypothetical protein
MKISPKFLKTYKNDRNFSLFLVYGWRIPKILIIANNEFKLKKKLDLVCSVTRSKKLQTRSFGFHFTFTVEGKRIDNNRNN